MTYRFSVDISSVFLVGEPMGVTDEASSDTLGKRKQQMEKFSTEKKKNCVFAWNVWKNRKERERKKKKQGNLT